MVKLFQLYADWTEAAKRDWMEKRQQGQLGFILKYGVFRWGTWMFLVLSLYSVVTVYGAERVEEPRMGFATFLLFNSIVCLSLGLAYGYLIWRVTERSFRKRFPGSS